MIIREDRLPFKTLCAVPKKASSRMLELICPLSNHYTVARLAKAGCASCTANHA